MKRIVPVIALLAGSSALASLASEPAWEVLPGPDGSVLLELDRDSVGQREGILTLWLRLSFAEPVPSRRHLAFHSAVAEHAVDCARRRHAAIRMTTYSGKLGEGDVIDRWDRSPQDWAWRSARGDPVDEGIVALACAQPALTRLSRPVTTSSP
ncbi:MAG: surface-adhesin E family protein [Gammaproteobacteria bacterium]